MLFEKNGKTWELTDPVSIDCFTAKGWKPVVVEPKAEVEAEVEEQEEEVVEETVEHVEEVIEEVVEKQPKRKSQKNK